jgi:hypothetical protein
MQMCSAPIEASISASAIHFLPCFLIEMYTIFLKLQEGVPTNVISITVTSTNAFSSKEVSTNRYLYIARKAFIRFDTYVSFGLYYNGITAKPYIQQKI